MTIEIESSPLWDNQICSMFAGIVLFTKDPEIKKIAGINFVRCYKMLDPAGKQLIRDSIESIKKDPRAAFDDQIEFLKDAFDSGLLDQINKDAL
jgi:hypothetical protein